MKRNRNRGGLIATLLLAGVLGTSAYAFTASNDLSSIGSAGDGQTTVSGYTVTNISFSIPSTFTGLTTVTFNLDAAATTVKASGSTTGSGLVDCNLTDALTFAWSCDLNESLHDAGHLRIAASS
jgi:hypothetical protein